jgi:hypothetical protein
MFQNQVLVAEFGYESLGEVGAELISIYKRKERVGLAKGVLVWPYIV